MSFLKRLLTGRPPRPSEIPPGKRSADTAESTTHVAGGTPGSERAPDNTKMNAGDDLEAKLAQAVAKHASPEQIEALAVQVLAISPHNDAARLAWKQSRKAQGKSLSLDLPENEKRAIYRDLKLTESRLESFNIQRYQGKLQTTRNLKETMQLTSALLSEAQEAARTSIRDKYRLSAFQLELLRSEAELLMWDAHDASASDQPAAKAEPYRSRLLCPHCSTRSVAAYWPPDGDRYALCWQTAQETLGGPGEYRLPVLCGGCGKKWYVVWDDSPPDPIGGLFLQHLDRMIDRYPALVNRLTSDDILGGAVITFAEIIRERQDTGSWNAGSISRGFQVDNLFNLVTLLPAADAAQARRFLPRGYMAYLDECVERLAPNNIFREVSLIHWIYIFLPAAETCIAHLAVFAPPSSLTNNRRVGLFPMELLTEQEARQFIR